MRPRTFLTSSLGAIVLSLCTSLAVFAAIPPLPHIFSGAITAAGIPVYRGATLQAYVRGSLCGQVIISTAGSYGISVSGQDPDNPSVGCQAQTGDQITFRLSYGGVTQNLSPSGATWRSDGRSQVDLHYPNAIPTPTPTPTSTPTPLATNTPTPTNTPTTFDRQFRGYVYKAPPRTREEPEPNVTVKLYGARRTDELGTLLETGVTDDPPDTGRFVLVYRAGGGATDYAYYNIVLEDPAWESIDAESLSNGEVISPTWIQFARPATNDLIKLNNNFWVRQLLTPTPSPSVTVEPTMTATPSVTPSSTPTGTEGPTNTPEATETSEPTETATPTVTVTPTETATPTITPTSGPYSPTPTRQPGTGWVQGRVWRDLNRDRFPDSWEPGLTGVELTLVGLQDRTIITTTQSGEDGGLYIFPNILLGGDPNQPSRGVIVQSPALNGYNTYEREVQVILSAGVVSTVHFGYVPRYGLYLPMIRRNISG